MEYISLNVILDISNREWELNSRLDWETDFYFPIGSIRFVQRAKGDADDG